MHIVAIVGRPNVGKSALFNRLAKKEISLVFDRPGVTRDRIVTNCDLAGHPVELIDTGGMGLDDDVGFGRAIEREAEIALTTASDILFVVDGREGVTALDQEVAKKLRRRSKRILLVVNKVDQPKLDHLSDDFHRLGFSEVIPVSAAHGYGIGDLLEILTKPWPAPEPIDDDAPSTRHTSMRIAILGRPNVGKSSLINALLKDDRAIVSAVPGTTHDNVDVPFEWEGSPYTLIDTAGMRQERKVRDELESRMTGRSAHAVNRANLCVLVLDVIAGAGLQEKKIGGLISKANKPCIIVCNKWDLAKDLGDTNRKARDLFMEVLRRDLFFLTYAPAIFTSAKSGENVVELMKWVGKINANRLRKIPTARLNDILHRAQERQLSPARSNRRFKIYYATQQFQAEKPSSTPTFLVFINDMRLLTPSYQRFMEEQLRSEIELDGCPIRWIWKEKNAEKK